MYYIVWYNKVVKSKILHFKIQAVAEKSAKKIEGCTALCRIL